MKITIEGEGRKVGAKDKSPVAMTLEELGSQGWITIEVDGDVYEFDYREFWNAARAVCISSYTD